MKLAIVRQKYNPYGGAERFVERALAALSDRDLSVTLITRDWPRDVPGRDVRICRPLHFGRLWRDVAFARCVRRLIGRGEFDLVQSHERIPGCAIYRAGDGVHATWLERRGRVQSPLARLATRLNPWHRYTLAAEAALFRHPGLRGVICNSRMVAEDIGRRFGVAANKLNVIYNGVDLDEFHPRLRDQHRQRVRGELGIADAAPLLLLVGSGFERKGVAQLLAALARLRGADIGLLVVGEDKRRAAMEALAASLGIAARVRFLGGKTDVRPYYGAADAFVLPTLYDPLPNAALEALACGLPVVTSPNCGAAELIVDGQSGFIVDPLDSAALAERCARVAGLDRDAARQAVAGLSLAAMAQRLADLYARLAQ